jgi:hypothetical protein
MSGRRPWLPKIDLTAPVRSDRPEPSGICNREDRLQLPTFSSTIRALEASVAARLLPKYFMCRRFDNPRLRP